MTEREAILTLLPDSAKTVPPSLFSRPLPGGADLWQIFEERLTELGGVLARVEKLAEINNKSVIADDDAKQYIQQFPHSEPEDVWSAEIGVTMVDCAVAETGTILIENLPGRRRLASLAPPVHIALVRENAIVRSLDEAIARIGDRAAVMITGPSRTADIAGTLIRGVHGPKELWVIRLPANE